MGGGGRRRTCGEGVQTGAEIAREAGVLGKTGAHSLFAIRWDRKERAETKGSRKPLRSLPLGAPSQPGVGTLGPQKTQVIQPQPPQKQASLQGLTWPSPKDLGRKRLPQLKV